MSSSSEEKGITIQQLSDEGEKLVAAFNATTGYSTENPNPLTVRMTRLIKEAKEQGNG